ncbi:MAG: type I phosphomannose isomerase catalytic subunit [Planctomycetaceae bacterium]
MEPLVFEPFLRPQVWGGNRLAHFGKLLPAGKCSIGESWELSCHPLHVSCVAQGPLKGSLLSDLWDQHRREIAGPDYIGPDRFPLLVKLLNCEEPLSVQVHPGDHESKRLGMSDPGKCEAWIVLETSCEARLDAGLKEGVGQAEFERRLNDGTVDQCLNHLVPDLGDCLYLPSGTVHSARGGVVLVEVQPSSDSTFRLYDWDRKDARGHARPLHREHGLDVIDWSLGPLGFVDSATSLPLGQGASVTQLLATPKFHLNRYDLRQAFSPKDLAGRMVAWVVISGEATLRSARSSLPLKRGETVLVPASATGIEWEPTDEWASLIAVTLGPEFETPPNRR